MKARGVASIALVSLAACGASSRVMRGPDGTDWYQIECRDHGDCLDEAGRICPRGYAVADRSSTVRGAYYTGYSAVPVTRDSLLIRCTSAPRATSGDPGF